MSKTNLPVFRTIKAMRDQVAAWKADGLKIGLVPTMGALHAGHLSLIDELCAHGADKIIVSIFVNPTQFAAHEDLDTYPRQEADDMAALSNRAACAVFAPSAAEMYPEGFATSISLKGPALGLETDERPHFFAGVALIVCKLLLQSQTDMAIFGEKDYQQLLVIRQMARDLNLPVDILGAPIIREADGLAMSSRNVYLTDEQRTIAGHLNRVMKHMATSPLPVAAAESEATEALLEAGFTAVDYATIRDAETLGPVTNTTTARRVLMAARLGDVRLIDNMRA